YSFYSIWITFRVIVYKTLGEIAILSENLKVNIFQIPDNHVTYELPSTQLYSFYSIWIAFRVPPILHFSLGYINRGPSRASALEAALPLLSAIHFLPTRHAHSPKVLLVEAVTHVLNRTCPHLSPYTQSVSTLVWLVAARQSCDQARECTSVRYN